jgi:hypothetical protein
LPRRKNPENGTDFQKPVFRSSASSSLRLWRINFVCVSNVGVVWLTLEKAEPATEHSSKVRILIKVVVFPRPCQECAGFGQNGTGSHLVGDGCGLYARTKWRIHEQRQTFTIIPVMVCRLRQLVIEPMAMHARSIFVSSLRGAQCGALASMIALSPLVLASSSLPAVSDPAVAARTTPATFVASANCNLSAPAFCETFNHGPSTIRGRGGTWTPPNGRRRGC